MILTPHQFAKELIDKFINSENMIFSIEGAKECALITVDYMQLVMSSLWSAAGINENKRSSYLEEVKKEIEKL
jgi:hypothetical protein